VTKFRPHRGLLVEAMKEVVELEDRAALVAHLIELGYAAKESSVEVENYGGMDARIGWDTHIVCIDGDAVGFTDGAL